MFFKRLKQHRWIHSGYAPYRCDGCDRGFRHVAHLRRHRAKEHGAAAEERAFKCPRCPRAFIYAYQLRTHANVVHGGIREEEEEEGRRAEEEVIVGTWGEKYSCFEVFVSFLGK